MVSSKLHSSVVKAEMRRGAATPQIGAVRERALFCGADTNIFNTKIPYCSKRNTKIP